MERAKQLPGSTRSLMRAGSTAATARANGYLVLFGNAQPRSVFRMNFDEGAGRQFVQRRHLAGLGQGVPLVLHAAGIEHNGVVVIRQLRRGQPGPGEEARLAAGGGKASAGQPPWASCRSAWLLPSLR